MEWAEFFPCGARVLALPNWKRARFYLPAHSFSQRWLASGLYPAYSLEARLYRLLLRTRAAVGLAFVKVASSEGWPLREFTQGVLPKVKSTVVLVGTPGPAQKITVQLRGDKGKVIGYLKYAEKNAARYRLRREYQTLCRLPKGLAPAPLKYGPLGDGEALVMSPLQGRPPPATLPPPKGIAQFLETLVLTPPVSVDAHPWMPVWREKVGAYLDLHLESLAARKWPVVIYHGDFAPWNLFEDRGALSGLDWESSSFEGFPYLDLAYFVLAVALLVYRWDPSTTIRYAVRYLTRSPWPGLAREEARAILRLSAYSAYQDTQEVEWLPTDSFQAWLKAVWSVG